MSSVTATFEDMKNKQMEVESSSSALEADSKRMEERLCMLKKMMSVEKASRIAKYGSSGARFWKSSQNDPQILSRQNTSTTGSVDKKKCVRVKVLAREGEGTVKVKRCGQCDKTAAKLVCIECTENYCLSCFAKFHQKGALSKHRVKPLTKKVRETTKELPSAKTSCVASTTTSSCEVQTGCDGIEVNKKSRGGDGGGRSEGSGRGLLWEGEYDEQASAQSFQEALAEWRAGSKGQLQDPTNTPGTATSTVIIPPTTSQTCSTQTADISDVQSLTADPQEGVHFSKYSGGVSYLERLMVRHHCSDRHFHIPDHCQNKEIDEEVREGEREGELREEEEERGMDVRGGGRRVVSDAKEIESRDSQNQVPSQYNLFHSGIKDEEWNIYSGLPSSVAGSECATTLSSTPTSSVQIEEVKFTKCCDKPSNLKEHNDDSHSDEKKGISTSKGHSSHQGKEKRHLSQRKKNKEKRQQKHTSKPCQSLATARKQSSPVCQSFTSTVIQVLKQHKVVSTTSHDHEKLSDFFLCGVKPDDIVTGNGAGEYRDDVQEANSSKLCLPISATIWLPDNSVPSEVESTCTLRGDPYLLVPTNTSNVHSDNLKPNPLFHNPYLPLCSTNSPSHCLSPPSPSESSPHSSHNPLLGTSIYHIPTDLPPPSRTLQQIWSSHSLPGKPSTTSDASTSPDRRALSLTDSESDDEDMIECIDDHLGEGNEGYGEDSEALDDLAWELQSLTGGRSTQCEGKWEGEEDEGGGGVEEEGGGGGAEEEGESGGAEELEAGIERVKTSFEIYHQQLMQQDSD